MKDEFVPNDDMCLMTERYLTKRMSVKLVTGEIVTGTVGWYNEYDFEEETGVECDWGFELKDVIVDGKPLGYDVCIPESRIEGYCPLEPANTHEEIDRLLGGKKD